MSAMQELTTETSTPLGERTALSYPEGTTWVYVFVRQDLSIPQQLVQASHACLQSGILFSDQHNLLVPSSLVIIGVPDKQALNRMAVKLLHYNIDHVPFYEPTDDEGLTAIASRPVVFEEKAFFSTHQLWEPKVITQDILEIDILSVVDYTTRN